MKKTWIIKFLACGLLAGALLVASNANAQKKSKSAKKETTKSKEDKSKRPSPPASVTETISSGATISINYGQPSLNGRTPGIDVEPKDDTVWRAGANEATVFETDKDVTINGQALPAGKYAFFTIKHGEEWTLIFNKVWKTWGAYDYSKNKDQDALTVTVPQEQPLAPSQKLLYTIDKAGKVTLIWGPEQISFNVQ
ncbi:MAG: hypothetical protein DI598_10035 [Pseudopedobacter saltans]|uniref:DUF2911 domain-containing protein n=1 Tax=Pseudopedobacter saltans TaxID=151895 RepID=A0A2W5EWD5_9SPHI|nr:MAG: hypothetical protein DI598_10035 [Pseudopedobacter saltans]